MTNTQGGFVLDEPPPSVDADDPFGLDVQHAQQDERPKRPRITKLSTAQEHRLIDYLDQHFLDLSRGVSKRHLVDSPLHTLSAFIDACTRLLHVILPIPPYYNNQLRADYLLRLTDAIEDVVGYDLSVIQAKTALFGFLDELDRGWSICLEGKEWPQDSQDDQLLPQSVSVTQTTRLLSICLHLKTILGNALQQAPSLSDIVVPRPEAGTDLDSDSDSEADVDMNDTNHFDDGASHVESVLHVELDVKRIFGRTLRIISGT